MVMKAWESAEWFAKWLELARIDIEQGTAEDPLVANSSVNAHVTSSLGYRQSCAPEEHKLAA
jgi:hypothetical protein